MNNIPDNLTDDQLWEGFLAWYKGAAWDRISKAAVELYYNEKQPVGEV